jgi:hypothetical protein
VESSLKFKEEKMNGTVQKIETLADLIKLSVYVSKDRFAECIPLVNAEVDIYPANQDHAPITIIEIQNKLQLIGALLQDLKNDIRIVIASPPCEVTGSTSSVP